MIVRRLSAAIAAVALALLVLRSAAVEAWSGSDPELAVTAWRGHPAAESALAEVEIGRLARQGRLPQSETLDRLDRVAIAAPMAIEPLLAKAIAAAQAGQPKRAELLLRIARQRSPRSLATRYFLADLYLRGGRVDLGLQELVDFARLAPEGNAGAAPYLAGYARNRTNWPHIRPVLARRDALAGAVLDALAADPDNAATLMALAPAAERNLGSPWAKTLLNAMIGDGRHEEALRLWRSLGRHPSGPGELLRDPDFSAVEIGPPFGWALIDTRAGEAERRDRAGLHAIFYGNESGVLARQLLLLDAGRYRLTSRSSGRLAEPQAMSWAIACARPARPLAEMPLGAPGSRRLDFAVPGDCAAQWLELRTRAQDMGGTSDVVIERIALERLGG